MAEYKTGAMVRISEEMRQMIATGDSVQEHLRSELGGHTVSDARERLVEKMVLAGEPLSLDAFLAHPDDLIALLVEMGALDPTAIHCDDGSLILLGPEEKVMSGDVVLYRRAPEGES